MTQLELLEIAERAIAREIKRKQKKCDHLNYQLIKVTAMIRAEKEKNNEQ